MIKLWISSSPSGEKLLVVIVVLDPEPDFSHASPLHNIPGAEFSREYMSSKVHKAIPHDWKDVLIRYMEWFSRTETRILWVNDLSGCLDKHSFASSMEHNYPTRCLFFRDKSSFIPLLDRHWTYDWVILDMEAWNGDNFEDRLCKILYSLFNLKNLNGGPTHLMFILLANHGSRELSKKDGFSLMEEYEIMIGCRSLRRIN